GRHELRRYLANPAASRDAARGRARPGLGPNRHIDDSAGASALGEDTGDKTVKIDRTLALALMTTSLLAAEVVAVIPKAGPPLAGPYSPGVFADDYLYVSGQGAKKPDGSMPTAFEDQVKQTLENVKMIVEAAGLTMDNVVYTQVYLEDIAKYA